MKIIKAIGKIMSNFSITNIIFVVKNVPKMTKDAMKSALHFVGFFIVLIDFLMEKFIKLFAHVPILGLVIIKVHATAQKLFGEKINKVLDTIERKTGYHLRRSYLIYLAFSNLSSKKSRSLVTIFGMAIGVGIIVYLLSLGYGIERLIIKQVAGLEELKVVDVSASENTALKLNRLAVSKIEKIDGVESVIPIVSLVGRINFNQAQTDVLASGINHDYFMISKLKLKKGRFFSDKYKDSKISSLPNGRVAGAKTEMKVAESGDPVDDNAIEYNLAPDKTIHVYESCENDAKLLGYTRRIEGGYLGQKVWGGSYAPFSGEGASAYDKNGEFLGKWVRGKFPLFTKSIEGSVIPKISSGGQHEWENGCIQASFVQEVRKSALFGNVGDVLGEATGSAELNKAISDSGVEATGSATPAYDVVVMATDSAGIEMVQLEASNSAKIATKNSTIKFKESPSKEAIVSTGLLNLLGLKESDVLKKSIDVQFIIVGSLIPSVDGKMLSTKTNYKIVGLIEDPRQIFYVPFYDLKMLGVENLSQVKAVMKDKGDLPLVRKQIESMGFKTSSVVDTVAQIEALFLNVRFVLGLVGMIALGVASLGMFNTLTVSLLERTREIGGMKAIGMVSIEVLDLLLAEAMIMGFAGGIGGLILGILAGEVTSMILSIIGLVSGSGFLDLTYLPLNFIMFIIFLSFVVGIITGMYPARRAKKISALNALRYE